MAGETKPSDSKIFQLIVLLITTVVAPVSVYVLTHSFDQKILSSTANQPPTAVLAAEMFNQTFAPTLAQNGSTEVTPTGAAMTTITATSVTSPTLTATNTAVPATPTVPTATNTVIPSPTSHGTVNPQGNIPAGSIVVSNDYSLVVEAKDIRLENETIALNLHIRNLSSKTQTFVYSAQTITVKDDTGRKYEVLFGEKKDACRKQDLEILKKVELKPNQEVTIYSVTTQEVEKWCGRDSSQLIPLYAGPVSDKVKYLFVTFSGFGTFKGFSFEIKR